MASRYFRLLPALLLGLCLGGAASPAGAQGLRERGALLLEAGRFDEARALAQDFLAKDAADFEASILLCQSLIALGRPADAANYASKAWERRREPRLAEILGEGLYLQGRNEEALAWFQTYLTSVPEGAKAGVAFYFSGEIYLRLGHFGHADIALTAALKHDPGNARWWSRLGWAQEKAGDTQQSLKSYEAAIKLDPRLEDALIGRDRVLARIRG
jgi:tetratricopeptide (TPR) repeat protein